MRRLFSSLIGSSKARNRRSSGPATVEGRFAEAESDDAVEILVHRNSGGESESSGDTSNLWAFGQAWAAVGESGMHISTPDGRTTVVGSGNFGVRGCSKEDFMHIQKSVMDAFLRAEAFGDDDLASEVEQEIDILFDEFEQLKEVLLSGERGNDLERERDVKRLKTRIHDIVLRINERDSGRLTQEGSSKEAGAREEMMVCRDFE
jgi:hypothetical protein